MRLTDFGEFGLIHRISKRLPHNRSDVVVDIGDDVAVLNFCGSEYLLATCDAQVENVHFRLDSITPYQLGRKVVAVNVSDIASMGGRPTWALVSLTLPSETEVDFVDALYEGIQEEIAAAGAAIVGGNLSSIASGRVIDLFLMGKVNPEEMVLRSGAREGDLILVTGCPGESRAGLELIVKPGLKVAESTRIKVLDRHLTPTARLREGRILGKSKKVHAMLDVSDGLLKDLQHICEASGLGAEVLMADLTVSDACKEVAAAAGSPPEKWFLNGGEDYELLFTASPGDAMELKRSLEQETGTACHIIGRIVARYLGLSIISTEGRKMGVSESHTGWDHFSA